MVKLRCSCGYVWKYGGNMMYATCPRCRSKISVRKNKVVE